MHFKFFLQNVPQIMGKHTLFVLNFAVQDFMKTLGKLGLSVNIVKNYHCVYIADLQVRLYKYLHEPNITLF